MQRAARLLRHLRANPVLVDTTLASAFVVVTQLAIWTGSDAHHHRAVGAVLAVALTAPIAIRRRFPALVGMSVPIVGAFDHEWLNTSSIGYPLANFFALYALAVWTSNLWFAIGTASIVAGISLATVVTDGSASGSFAFVAIAVIALFFVRSIVGDRERRARLAERERDVAAREAVVDERTRIARELHDVIAHNVSMIVVQAGAERRVLDDSAGGTREVLHAIERTGRAALTEMRRLVGMLRSAEPDPLTPQPKLHQVGTLVDQVRDAGLPVELHVEGEVRPLPEGIELSAYRIVQESLTNTLKHAGHARAAVTIRYGVDSLELEISDDGRGAAVPEQSSGHGLVGMRERVALYGGRFDAEDRPSGGFAVRVLLPIR